MPGRRRVAARAGRQRECRCSSRSRVCHPSPPPSSGILLVSASSSGGREGGEARKIIIDVKAKAARRDGSRRAASTVKSTLCGGFGLVGRDAGALADLPGQLVQECHGSISSV